MKIQICRTKKGTKSFLQEFEIEATGKTILDILREIRDTQDSTLAFRAQCRSGICGSCAMRINGQARLACKTFAETVAFGGVVRIEPLANLPVIRDLVVEEGAFWQEIERIRPWIITQVSESAKDQSKQMADSMKTEDCILCEACFSDCEVQSSKSEGYVGPAGFVQSWRYMTDFRDQGLQERLALLEKQGIWSCTHMYNCAQACPKGIPVGEVISKTREKLLEQGYGKNAGGRHVTSFAYGIKKTGKLNEFWTHVKTRRLKFFLDISLGLRLILKGKIPWPWGQRSKKSGELKNFFEE